MSKFINILLNKGIKAPPLSWRTSWFGSAFNIISNSVKDFIKPNKLGKEFSNVMWSKPDAQKVKTVCDKFEKATGIMGQLVLVAILKVPSLKGDISPFLVLVPSGKTKIEIPFFYKFNEIIRQFKQNYYKSPGQQTCPFSMKEVPPILREDFRESNEI